MKNAHRVLLTKDSSGTALFYATRLQAWLMAHRAKRFARAHGEYVKIRYHKPTRTYIVTMTDQEQI